MKPDKKSLHELYTFFALIQNQREADIILRDMLTPREIALLAERWQLIQLLAQGTKQREIKKKLKISISKITRGARAYRHGSGGFAIMLRRLRKKMV